MTTLLLHPTAARVDAGASQPAPRRLTPRSRYPNIAPHLLRGGGPLPKLAWIFGLRRC